ncbi:MAG: HAD family hydrolase [Nitrospirae bacterium]|nr:HAD family hydrolase [Nitrospirota bacterium]
MLKAVIFDFDGVLAESVNIKTEAFRRLFEKEGAETVNKIVAYHLEHGGVSRFEKFRYIYKEILRRLLPEEEFERLCKRFKELVLEGVMTAPEVDGASECLKRLHGKVKLFIVSGTPEEEMRLIAKVRNIEHFFDGIYGSPETKTELVRKVLSTYNLKADEVVFIGDAMTDYDAAKETGTGFIARAISETEGLWRGLNVRRVKSISDCVMELGL